MKTKFIDCSGSKERTKTVFTHYFNGDKGYVEARMRPTDFNRVVYLGKRALDGDIFAAYSESDVSIYKGTKGDEF